jgi:hypothetical protein
MISKIWSVLVLIPVLIFVCILTYIEYRKGKR